MLRYAKRDRYRRHERAGQRKTDYFTVEAQTAQSGKKRDAEYLIVGMEVRSYSRIDRE